MVRKKSHFSGVPRTNKSDPTQDALTENIEVLTGQRGNELNRALLWRDLVNLDDMKRRALISAIKQSTRGGLPIIAGGGVERPHAPVNLQGTGGFTFIALTWNRPTYKGHAYAEIYRSETDVFSAAVRIATEVTDIFSDSVNMGAKYYYWVRFVNEADMKGPTQGANGLYVETMQSAAAILAELGGQIENSHLGVFLSGEVGKIPDLAFDIDQARLAADEVLSSNDALAIDIINSSSANDGNWQAVNASIASLTNTVNQNNAAIVLDYYTKVAADAAIALKNETLEATIIDPEGNSIGATVQQLSYTVVSNYGDFTAMWGVKTAVNEITASFGLLNDGVDPIFAIKGAKFAVITAQDPTVLTPVFSVVDGKTVMNSAVIDEAHIQSLVTDDLLANRLVVGLKLTTPSINYDPQTGTRTQNFSIDPSGNMLAKSATLESVTIKDNLGNVIMSSTGAISKDSVTGLGALSALDDISLSYITDAGPFAGLTKILSTNITTYIESGAIGSAQIDQAYIAELFGINASFSGTVYAENIEGDVYDAKTYQGGSTPADRDEQFTVFTVTIAEANFARVLKIGAMSFSSTANSASLLIVAYLNDVAVPYAIPSVAASNSTNELTQDIFVNIPANTPSTVKVKATATISIITSTTFTHLHPTLVGIFKSGGALS